MQQIGQIILTFITFLKTLENKFISILIASVETWKAKGIEDPIAHFQKEVDELNSQRKNEGVPKISTVSPELYLGYFPFVSLMNKMNIKNMLIISIFPILLNLICMNCFLL